MLCVDEWVQLVKQSWAVLVQVKQWRAWMKSWWLMVEFWWTEKMFWMVRKSWMGMMFWWAWERRVKAFLLLLRALALCAK